MSTDIVMPKLSDTMEEGTILKWLKQVGDTVAAGEVIAEVETDKADMELEAAEGGVLSAIQVQAGQSAAVGTVLAVLDGKGQAGDANGAAKGAPKSTATGVPEAVDEPGADRVESPPGEAPAARSKMTAAARPGAAKPAPAKPAPPKTVSTNAAPAAPPAGTDDVKASAAARARRRARHRHRDAERQRSRRTGRE
jgi:pyruvate dehydrogenase E2 component (dihydrolipoamide acetyltransferase)